MLARGRLIRGIAFDKSYFQNGNMFSALLRTLERCHSQSAEPPKEIAVAIFEYTNLLAPNQKCKERQLFKPNGLTRFESSLHNTLFQIHCFDRLQRHWTKQSRR